MTELGLFPDEPDAPQRPGRRRAPKKKSIRRIVPFVIVLIVLMGIIVAGLVGIDKIKDRFSSPADYEGQGSGEVIIEVVSGDTAADIARTLRAEDVIASVQAFIDEAAVTAEMNTIQPGFYRLRGQMSAQWAIKELLDKENRVENVVTIPEGFRVGQIIERVAAKTEISVEDLEKAVEEPESIGLPDYAKGNVEGYLFPATYTLGPNATAEDFLSMMVDKTVQVLEQLEVGQRAEKLGLSTEEVLVVASLIELEANQDEDYPKVARVIYNRLGISMLLQFDSTVSYLSQREGDVWTTQEERDNPSEYNTYRHPGLPPGPIGSPGEKTIEAALNPADGDWLYFVTDFENNSTVFSSNLPDHERAVDKARKYCRDNPDVC